MFSVGVIPVQLTDNTNKTPKEDSQKSTENIKFGTLWPDPDRELAIMAVFLRYYFDMSALTLQYLTSRVYSGGCCISPLLRSTGKLHQGRPMG